MLRRVERLLLGRWRLVGLVLIVALALVSSVYAYWRINSQASTAAHSEATVSPLELRIELDKTQFQLGETVAIRVYLKNISNQTIHVYFPHEDGRLGYYVKNASDIRIMSQGPPGFLQSVGLNMLAPGEAVTENYPGEIFSWLQTESDRDAPPYYVKQVKPGTYKIIGSTGIYLVGSLDIGPPWNPPIETPPITITIS